MTESSTAAIDTAINGTGASGTAISGTAAATTATLEPATVLLVGDTHHDFDWVRHVAHRAAALNVGAVVQVGDFGYFPGTDFGDAFLTRLRTDLGWDTLPPWYVLDGNHDNIPALAALPRDAGGFGVITEHIRYVPRGHRWTWSGTRFAALGGAISVDAATRVEGYNWWREESITYLQALSVIDAGPTDVLLTHDAGSCVPLRPGGKVDTASAGHRGIIDEVIDALTPQVHVHGHYHHGYQLTVPRGDGGRTRVVGLGMNEDPRFDSGAGYRVLHLPSLAVADGH